MNSSKKLVKSSYEEEFEDAFKVYPWDVNQVDYHSDEDLGLSAVIEIYGDEFVNVDDSTLNGMRDTLELYFDDDAFVRSWNINNPDDQIESIGDVSSVEDLSVDELATYFDYDAYGRDLRLEEDLVWDKVHECWVSIRGIDVSPSEEDDLVYLSNSRRNNMRNTMRKSIKSRRAIKSVFGGSEIDYSEVINPNDDGDIWLVKMWSGSGYLTTPYVVKANDVYEAIDRTFDYEYADEPNKLVFDYNYVSNEAHYMYKSDPDLYGEGVSEDDFVDKYIEETYVSNDDYDKFSLEENFFVDKVPDEYLSNSRRNNMRKSIKSRRFLKSAESYGWVVESSDASRALEMWIEAVGEEQAYKDVVDTLGSDELAEAMAYIFRMNDFREWDNEDDDEIESGCHGKRKARKSIKSRRFLKSSDDNYDSWKNALEEIKALIGVDYDGEGVFTTGRDLTEDERRKVERICDNYGVVYLPLDAVGDEEKAFAVLTEEEYYV